MARLLHLIVLAVLAPSVLGQHVVPLNTKRDFSSASATDIRNRIKSAEFKYSHRFDVSEDNSTVLKYSHRFDVPEDNSTVLKYSHRFDVPEDNSTVLKYSHRFQDKPESVRRRATFGLPMQNNDDSSFYSEITIGTPPQKFLVVMDTGSTIAWVPSLFCKTAICANKAKFDSKKSTTFKKGGTPVSIRYGTGDMVGTSATDIMSLNKLTLPKQSFLQAVQLGDFFAHIPLDGIVGLDLQHDPRSPSVLESLKANKALTKPVFGVYIRYQNPVVATDKEQKLAKFPPGGEITFGDINKARFTGAMTFLPVIKTGFGFWSVKMDDVLVGKKSVFAGGKKQKPSGAHAIVDTGTSLVVAPSSAAKAFAKLIGAVEQRQPDGTVYALIDCNKAAKLPNLTFVFGGRRFSVPNSVYILKATDNGKPICFSGVVDGGEFASDGSWIVGDMFLQSVYTVFDYGKTPKVGFANVKH